jgi:hypothetical protein
MGTRALTIFVSEYTGNDLCVMYRQAGGYPECHGKELAEFLSGIKMVNGISNYDDRIANGMGCLAAQTVAHFKDGVGSIYLKESGTRDVGEDYTYFITCKEGGETHVKISSYNEVLFDGAASDLAEKIKADYFAATE